MRICIAAAAFYGEPCIARHCVTCEHLHCTVLSPPMGSSSCGSDPLTTCSPRSIFACTLCGFTLHVGAHCTLCAMCTVCAHCKQAAEEGLTDAPPQLRHAHNLPCAVHISWWKESYLSLIHDRTHFEFATLAARLKARFKNASISAGDFDKTSLFGSCFAFLKTQSVWMEGHVVVA